MVYRDPFSQATTWEEWNQLSAQEDIASRMRKYVDPLTGTISYSGADIKAVVFLPYPVKQLEKELEKLAKERGELSTFLRDLQAQWDTLSRAYNKAFLTGQTDRIPVLGQQIAELHVDRISLYEAQLQVLNEQYNSLLESYQMRGDTDYISRPVVLGNVQTISYSVHREKFPVRSCGRVSAKSYTRGSRTIAGSLIFTVLNEHALHELTSAALKYYNTGVGVAGTDSGWPELSTVIVDQLPPFDITLVASNEIGDNSYMCFYGVEITNEGGTMSIQDLLTESVMQYVARDYDPLRKLSDKRRVLDIKAPYPVTASEVAKQSKLRRQRRLDPFV